MKPSNKSTKPLKNAGRRPWQSTRNDWFSLPSTWARRFRIEEFVGSDTFRRVSAPDQSVIAILLMMLVLAAIILGVFCACLAGFWVRKKQESENVDTFP